MAAHPIVHMEFSAQDPAASAKFYSEVFGWKIEVDNKFDYYMFAAEGGPAGGFVKPDGQMYKKGDVIAYIDTDSVDEALKKIESLGGKTVAPKTEIPGIGWFAFFSDPGGNKVGLFQTNRPAQ